MLEFNMPVHEGWNIVHIAMQVPECHQIYVCPENCARGVVMTAYEMGAQDRFSCVSVSERDLIVDNLETVTIDGVSNVVEELREGSELPRVIFLFTVCSHRILSCDFNYVFKTLRDKFPEIIWVHAFMDCIAQKEGPTPDMKLRKAMYEFIPKTHSDEQIVNILGSEVTATRENNDLIKQYESHGYKVRQLADIKTFDEYMQLGNAALNICMLPHGDYGVRNFSERLGIPYQYKLPYYDKIDLGWIRPELESARNVIGDTPIVIDSMAVVCPYSFAEFLLDNSFNVFAVISDGPADYEQGIFEKLQEKYPSLITINPIDPVLREEKYRENLIKKADSSKILGIGPMAGWVFDTPYFVNQIENDGAYGNLGVKALFEKIREAVNIPKDIEKTVVQKGLGSERCLFG
ncbi:MAG: nitrogenase [Lachnospiraceae bacterium]|uniref:Nitrogenase n=1 Tax=Candidatus Weimeria bifida TaxID=2599074 RepID=A0A6N7J2C9_9FIRM|nr:nitrogenase [Candidatus Weimeria bifida]RRF97418.1 MAG: nitrogenase [Lachnospiraceae bacterium]